MGRVNLKFCPLAVTAPGGCCWCGRNLNGQQTVWCSDPTCKARFEKHHIWASARWAAMVRDGHQCVKCGSKIALEVNHIIPLAHTSPGKKDPYGPSCAHHQDGLETLCHKCHLVATAKQRADGLIKKRKPQPKPKPRRRKR